MQRMTSGVTREASPNDEGLELRHRGSEGVTAFLDGSHLRYLTFDLSGLAEQSYFEKANQ